MRAGARELPPVSRGVAASARQFALLQLLLVETFSFFLAPPGSSSALVLLQRKLSRVDFGPPRPSHQEHRHYYHRQRQNGFGCRQTAHFSHRDYWSPSPSHSYSFLHQSRPQPSRSALVPFRQDSTSNNSSSSGSDTTTTATATTTITAATTATTITTSSRRPRIGSCRLQPSTSTASRPFRHRVTRSILLSARRQPFRMGAASSNPAVSQRSALRPRPESADNGYSYGAAITSLGASQADAEAPPDFEDPAAASLGGGETIGELRWPFRWWEKYRALPRTTADCTRYNVPRMVVGVRARSYAYSYMVPIRDVVDSKSRGCRKLRRDNTAAGVRSSYQLYSRT